MTTIPAMTRKEQKDTREFIARWLMEFGSGSVTWDETRACKWYVDSDIATFDHLRSWAFKGDRKKETTTLQQIGLDFLSGSAHPEKLEKEK